MEANPDTVTRTAPEPQVAIVPPAMIDAAWPVCREWLEAALGSSQQHELSIDTVYERLQDGEYLMLLLTAPGVMASDSGMAEIKACAVICRSVSRQSGQGYIGLIGAGGCDAALWVAPLYRALRDLAIAEGCDRVLVVGRPGWRRLVVPLGARHVGEILVMDNLKVGAMGSVSDNHSSNSGVNFANSVANSISNAWNNSQATNSSVNNSQATNSSVNNASSSTDSFNQGVSGSQGTSTQSVYAPQATTLNSIYNQAGQLANGQGQPARDAAGVNRSARAAWEQSLQPGGNPYFSQNVQGAIDQATQSFNRGVLPQMTAAGVGGGAYGTSRDSLARGEAAGLAQQGIQQMVGGMYADQYATDAAARTAALGMAPQIQGMATAPLTTAAGIVGGPTVLGQSTNSSFGNTVGGSTGQSVATGSSTGQSTTAGSSTGQSTTAGGSASRSGARSRSHGNTSGRSSGNEFGVLSK